MFDTIAILPEIVLTLAGIFVMLTSAFFERGGRRASTVVAHLGLLATVIAVGYQWNRGGAYFRGMFLIDSFGLFFHLLFLLIAALVMLSVSDYLDRENLPPAEFHALILFATVGMGIMVSSSDLILIFIGLEISSLASYILVGFRRDASPSSEAALKYFLLGSFATAFLLYGIALIFGATGSTRLPGINVALLGGHQTATLAAPAGSFPGQEVQTAQVILNAEFPVSLAALAIALVFVGLAFKVSAAPFQIWTPDVYQGAPTPASAFLSTGPKAAAFAAFLRIFLSGFGGYSQSWAWLIWIAAVLSMFIGNLAALLQTNIKRMLAYSAIAHAGYMLVAFTAHSAEGAGAVIFYLAAYAFMNVGAFMVVTHIGGPGERYLEIDDFAGLGYRFPFLAGALSIFLLSLIGVPLTAGFFGKFYIFRAALHGDLLWLTVLAGINSGIAAYYYLRVLVAMYMSTPASAVPCERLRIGMKLGLLISVLGTIILGVFPQPILDFANRAAQLLQQGQ